MNEEETGHELPDGQRQGGERFGGKLAFTGGNHDGDHDVGGGANSYRSGQGCVAPSGEVYAHGDTEGCEPDEGVEGDEDVHNHRAFVALEGAGPQQVVEF